MKALEQVLAEMEQEFDWTNPDEDTPYVDITLKAVKKWLKQKRKEKEQSPEIVTYLLKAKLEVIDELLAELKK